MFKKSVIRNPKAKGLRVQHAVKTCLLIVLGIWMLYQLKLLLVNLNSRKNGLISTDVSGNKPKYMSNKQSKLTRKSLFRVETQVVSFQSGSDEEQERNNDKKRDEGDEERAQEKMKMLDYQIGEEADIPNLRNTIQTSEDTKYQSEFPFVSKRDEYESFEYSESVVDQDSKQDDFELEIYRSVIKIEE
ncbi:uncharacterized protein [Spinacia oleracea]|uniref:Transmembrane protein n=1 Tax=Spinacia oleracea TaxID=3562 RepID=A0ABM3QW92_SPIOL|nr:uncharacterized protein LOC130462753 [Spinacia oleracea]